MTTKIEKWDIFELTLEGPKTGNPFLEVDLTATFKYKHRTVEVAGFYDGEGVYKIRFMPDKEGEWTYETESNREKLNGKKGSFACVKAENNNQGPVRVDNKYHFAYAEGTPFYQIGTTCYVWNHQGDELEEQTLETLKEAPFNKLRMCVFPKRYDFNQNEPEYYPFAGSLEGDWDFERFNPEFFQHLEKRIKQLRDIGVQTDLILFHPYDDEKWGFSRMDEKTDDRYLEYVVTRLAPYRNIWWSMANEYDLMGNKSMADWDRFFRIVQENDPYQHLRSIHNCRGFYDHGKPWVTHCSIQRHETEKTDEWRQKYGKPVVIDECGYEGNIHHGWGNITAKEMVHRFWAGFSNGGYVGHGETYVHPEDILWWSKGGVLHGESPPRLVFLKEIMKDMGQVKPSDISWDNSIENDRGDYLVYLGNCTQSVYYYIDLPEENDYEIEVIDTWDMTVEKQEGTYSGRSKVDLPGKPYIAIKAKRI